jgi:hypothetical protein
MNSESEFQNTGKRMLYRVPDGFFSKITAETLHKAHLQEKAEKKRRIIRWRSLAAAASLIVMVVSGYLVFSPVPEKESEPVAHKIQDVPQTDKVLQGDLPVLSPVIETESYVKQTVDGENALPEMEKMEDLLASLSDDELLEWALALKTDYFITESENNMP